ncbi:MAG: hypothetical protein AB7F25_11420 [Deferribacterales bacterium]
MLCIFSVLLVSCGGGTTASKSRYSAKVKLEFEDLTASKSGVTSRMQVGSTLINSIIIGYGYGSNLSTKEVISSVQNDSDIYINGLEPGQEYSFTVSAYGPSGSMVCMGGDTATIIPGQVVDVNIICTFKDKYAVENMVLDVASKGMDGTLTSAEADAVVAANFGVKDGMDRSAFISDMMEEDSGKFAFDSGISLSRVELVSWSRSATAKTDVQNDGTLSQASYLMKFIYADGSVEFDDINFVIENDEWKIAGNGMQYGMKIRHAAIEFVDDPETTIYGLEVYKNYDDDSDNIDSLSVSGDGITTTGYTKTLNPDTGDYYMRQATAFDENLSIPDEINYSLIPYTGNVAGGASVAFGITEGSGTDSETYHIRGSHDYDAPAYSEIPTVSPLTSADKMSFLVQLPSWVIRADVHYKLEDGQGQSDDGESWLSMQRPSFYIDTASLTISGISDGALTFNFYDSNDSVYTIYMPYSYFTNNAVYGELTDDSFPALGGGFSTALSHVEAADESGITLNDIYYSSSSSVFAVGYSGLTTSDDVNYNPIVMKGSFTSRGHSINAGLIKMSQHDMELYNAQVEGVLGNEILLAAGIKDTNKVVVMRISSDLSTIKWVNTYSNGNDETSSASGFVSMALIKNSTEVAVLMKGYQGGVKTANMIKISAANGETLSATHLAEAGVDITPVAMGVVKSKNRVVLLTQQETSGEKSTCNMLVFDSDLNLIGNSTVIDDRAVKDLNLVVGSSNDKIYLSYSEKPDNGSVYQPVLDDLEHNLSTNNETYAFSLVYHNVLTSADPLLTVESYYTKLQESGDMLYMFFAGADDDSQSLNSYQAVAAVDMTSGDVPWIKSFMDIMGVSAMSPASGDSLLMSAGSWLFNLSAEGEVNGYSIEDVTSELQFTTTTITPVSASNITASVFVPTVNAAAADTEMEDIQPVTVKSEIRFGY